MSCLARVSTIDKFGAAELSHWLEKSRKDAFIQGYIGYCSTSARIFSVVDESMIHDGGLALLSCISKPAIYIDVYLK